MRINICAIGHIRNSPEEELIKDYINRFDRIGNIIGVGPIYFSGFVGMKYPCTNPELLVGLTFFIDIIC